MSQPIGDDVNSYRGKRVLITGTGYIAAAIVRLLGQVECEIAVLRRPSALSLPKQAGRAVLVDLPHGYWDRDAWASAIAGASAVIHLAAQTGARQAEIDRLADYTASVAPLALLLEACRDGGQRPVVVFASSVTVLGSPDHLPADETATPRPFGVYEIHKLLGEFYLADAVAKQQVRGTSLRIPNVYGPGPLSSSGERGVLGRVVRNAMQSGQINIYGDGAMLRDYLFVDDVAAAFLAVAPAIDSIRLPAYLLAGGAPLSLADSFKKAAARVEELTGKAVAVAHVPPPQGSQAADFRSYFGNARAFHDATGWRPAVDFDEGLRRTVMAIRNEGEARPWPQ